MKARSTGLDALFTTESLLSLHGAATATMLATNVLAYLIGPGFYPHQKWIALTLAMGLAFLVASQAPGKQKTKWLVAIFNGMLIFSAAAGLTQVLGATLSPAPGGGALSPGAYGPMPFFHSWYP